MVVKWEQGYPGGGRHILGVRHGGHHTHVRVEVKPASSISVSDGRRWGRGSMGDHPVGGVHPMGVIRVFAVNHFPAKFVWIDHFLIRDGETMQVTHQIFRRGRSGGPKASNSCGTPGPEILREISNFLKKWKVRVNTYLGATIRGTGFMSNP